jgi:hypothetical protein
MCDVSTRLFGRILKDMLEFKCGFLKIYADLELNCPTLHNHCVFCMTCATYSKIQRLFNFRSDHIYINGGHCV